MNKINNDIYTVEQFLNGDNLHGRPIMSYHAKKDLVHNFMRSPNGIQEVRIKQRRPQQPLRIIQNNNVNGEKVSLAPLSSSSSKIIKNALDSDLNTFESVANLNNNNNKSNNGPNIDNESFIFVSVASYRDSETPKTLSDLFKKARNPNRVIALVHEQNYPEDTKCYNFSGASAYIGQHIRVLKTPAENAQGPMWARALIEQELFDPEEASNNYWLQIDSHSTFIKDWDIVLIQQHSLLPNPEYNILSTYPPNFNPTTRTVQNVSLPTFIAFQEFAKNKECFPLYQKYQYKAFPKAPRMALFYGACFVFGSAEMVNNVPYDATMPYVFTGEELFQGARLFTHGYDLYNPLTSAIYHLTSRDYRPTYWEQFYPKKCKVGPQERAERKELELAAYEKLRILMKEPHPKNIYHTNSNNIDYMNDNSDNDNEQMIEQENEEEEEIPIYDIQNYYDRNQNLYFGSQRTLEDYYDFIGVNMFASDVNVRSRLGISPTANDLEWKEKYGVTKENWKTALTSLKPTK